MVNVSELMNRRALITGGAGFIGSHIAEALLAAGCRKVIAIDNLIRGREDNLHNSLKDRRFEFVKCDIRDRNVIEQLVQESDFVFHQAALRITHCAQDPSLARDVMLHATFDLFQTCARIGVRKVISASSASIYGLADRFPTEEDHHPYNDRTLYGSMKLFSEGLLRSLRDTHGLRYVALRYFNVYGPRMDYHGRYTEVIVRWLQGLDRGEAPVVFGTGHQTMDFVHVRDVARANVLAACSSNDDTTLNVGTGRATSLLQLAEALMRLRHCECITPEFLPERAVNPVPRRVADVDRGQRQIGFRAEIPLEEGLKDLIEWWRQQQDLPNALAS